MRIRPRSQLGDLADRLVEQVAVVRDGDNRAVEAWRGAARAASGRRRRGAPPARRAGARRDPGRGRPRARSACAGRPRGRSSAASGRPPRARGRAASRAPRPSMLGPPAASQRSTSSSWRRRTRDIRSRSAASSGEASCSATRCSSRSSSSRSGRAARTVSSAFRSSPSGCCGRNEMTMPRRRTEVPASGSSSPAISLQHRRLAGAVGADHADAGARLDREVEPVEHGSAAERLADGVQADRAPRRYPLRTTESTYSSWPSRSASARRASPEIPLRAASTS